MKINYGVSGWPSWEVSLEDAFIKVLYSRSDANGELEELKSRVDHLEAILRLILTPEQMLVLAK